MSNAAGPPSWWSTVDATSASAGVDPNTLWKIYGAETSYGKNLVNPNSSARGPFQITKDTWSNLAQLRPSLGLTDPMDPTQSATAAPWLLKMNNDVMANELGRQPTDAEQYIGWHAGVGRAATIIKAPSDTPVTQLFSPQAIAQNSALFDKVQTAGEYRAWAAQKMGDTGYVPPINPEPTEQPQVGNVSLASSVLSQPVPEAVQYAQQVQQRENEWSLGHAAWETMQDTDTAWLLKGAKNLTYAPDPNFNVSMDMMKQDPRLKGIPEQYWGTLVGARSQDDYDNRVARVQSDVQYGQKMNELGLEGTALKVAGQVLDPSGWLISLASPLSGGALKVGRVGKILLSGVEAAAGNTLNDLPAYANKPTYDPNSLMYTAAGSFLFGTGIGAVAHWHPAITNDVAAMQKPAADVMQKIDTAYAPNVPGAGGAAPNLGYVAPTRNDIGDFLTDEFGKQELDKVWKPGVRFDLASRMKDSDNPLVAALGSRLVEDPVGNADHSAVHIPVSVEAGDLNRTASAQLQSSGMAAWSDFAKRNDIGWFNSGGEQQRFFARVADWIEERDPEKAALEDPAVQSAGTAARQFLDRYHTLATNPGALDGTERAAVRGMEGVPNDPNYFPHLWDFHEFGGAVKRFGDTQVKQLLTEAIRSRVPDIENGVLKKLGAGLYKGLRNVASGQEAHVSNILGGTDREALAGFLREHADISDKDLNYVMGKLMPESENGSIARTKSRTPLDANTKMALQVMDESDPQYGQKIVMSPRDLMDRNYIHALSSYSRQMSTQIALARLRIGNPRYRSGVDEPGEQYLVDGIRGDSDWQTLMKKVGAVNDAMGHGKEAFDKDKTHLQFTYDTLTGHLQQYERGKWGAIIRALKNYNFMRMMGQVGWAQAGETWVGVSQVGLKAAMSQMPGFRSFIRDARTGALSDDVAKQLEYMVAPGTDHLRSSAHLITDDYGNVVQKRGTAHVVEDVSARGARGMSMLSGMAPITEYQQRWFARAAMARFAMDATGEKALNMRRMAALGIDEKMRAKIAQQLQDHDGYTTGESGTQLRMLNLDKWEPDARYSLERALGLWTRKMVQENDIGQMNMMLGGTMGKLMTQFRAFMLGAYTKNMLHNFHMGDFENASMILGTTVFAGLGYIAQTHLQAVGRSDKDRFLQRRLDNGSIAAAAVQRAVWSTVAPMIADNAGYMMGFDPVFDQRVTGTPSQGIFSNPTFALTDTMQQAGRGIGRSLFTNEQYNQRDARAALGLVPFANLLPAVMLSNSLISGLPEQDTHAHH